MGLKMNAFGLMCIMTKILLATSLGNSHSNYIISDTKSDFDSINVFYAAYDDTIKNTPSKKIREVEEQRKQKEMSIIEEFKKNRNPKKEEAAIKLMQVIAYCDEIGENLGYKENTVRHRKAFIKPCVIKMLEEAEEFKQWRYFISNQLDLSEWEANLNFYMCLVYNECKNL